MSARLEIHVLLVTAIVTLGACNSVLAPIDVAAGCPEQPLHDLDLWPDVVNERLVDGFENPDAELPKLGGRDGAWIMGDDGTSGAYTAESSDRCAARGVRAGHFAGKGYTSWGANWTALFRHADNNTATPWDGRAYSGLSFWAAVGPATEPPFDVPVGVTTMDDAWNGGICAKCMDAYTTVVHLSPNWQRIVISFDELAQSGFGDPLIPLRRDQLVGFIIWPSHPFDIWIDDLRFEP